MFLRLVQLRININNITDFEEQYAELALPTFEKMPGSIFAGLLQSNAVEDDFLSLTLWKDQQSAENYESSGEYNKLITHAGPFLAESEDWSIQLSENLELEYLPNTEEPVLKEFSVTAQTEENIQDEKNENLHVRIVSMTIAEEKLNEFRELYKKEVITGLQRTKGCRYIFLTENQKKQNEVLSITLWDSKSSSEKYENSGGFTSLFEKVEHTMSEQYKWKKAMDELPGHYNLTTEDMKVSHYELVNSKVFKR